MSKTNLLWTIDWEKWVEWLTFSTHSYSPNLESKVPFCSERSLSVKRGPSSWIPAFFSFLKMYLNRTLCNAHSAPQLSQDASSNYIWRAQTESCAFKWFTLHSLTCGTWKKWSLSGCGRWPPAGPETVGLGGKGQQTVVRCCDPDVWRSCSKSPRDNVPLGFCLVSAERKHSVTLLRLEIQLQWSGRVLTSLLWLSQTKKKR